MQSDGARSEGLAAREVEFISAADSFYLGSVGETGWPYVQHRGGPAGFLKVISPTRLAYADFRGNRQYVSAGNVSVDNRVSLFIMDYANQRRLKLLGRLRFQQPDTVDPALVAAVVQPDYRGRVEQIAVIDLEAFDWNCPQHIRQRFTLAQVSEATRPLHERIARLEEELKALRGAAG
jgi:predicted pyridoxine 5'-phosphate oxidase superfamily flavin-nucleotide-binding protein